MKKAMIIIIFLLCSSELSWAQDKAAEQKIQAARIALITERLGLTPEQAEKFWPLYNEFSQKRKGLRQEYNREKSKLNVETATEAEKKALLDLGYKLKEQSLQMERDYSDRMLKVISAQQVMSLRKAEEDFRKMILDQIQQRRAQNQRRREQMRDRNNERQQRRNN